MYQTLPTTLYHSNRYTAESACEHCDGVIRHETWCITKNAAVVYAYRAVLNAETLSLQDQLILHALGAIWDDHACRGNCKSEQPVV